MKFGIVAVRNIEAPMLLTVAAAAVLLLLAVPYWQALGMFGA
jgi:hypothetical protein